VNVWVVSHAYAAPVNHDKLTALARVPGLALTVLAPAAWRTPLGVVRPGEPRPGYRLVRGRVLFNGHTGGYLFREGLAGVRDADVVHAEVEPWSLAALQCRLATRAPLVVFTWENLAGPRHPLARAIERLVLRRAAFVIAGNQEARARMRRHGVDADRLAVLPQFGVDPARYAAPGRESRPARAPVVGYVGRLVSEKGVDLLVEALETLDARLLVVGDGPTRPALEARARAWPPGKARFVGAVAHEAVPGWLGQMDVLVLPSRTTARWAEQFGHVLIEAMAAGVAVVGSASGAIPEVVADAGLLFAEGDAGDLARQVRRLLDDDDLRRRLTARGAARVARQYTHDAIAAAQGAIYVRLAAARARRPPGRPV
jgi:glycosyltransferase involved in cell wall biosynthesis